MMNKRIRLIQYSHRLIKWVLKEWRNILIIEWFYNIQIFSKLYINKVYDTFCENHHFDIHICVSYFPFYIDLYLNFKSLNLYIVVNFNFRRFVVISYVCHNFMIFTLFCIAHHIESNHILNFDFWVYWPSSTLS